MPTLRLKGKDINADDVSSTVEQLLLIFEELALMGDATGMVWYGADISPALGAGAPYDTGSPLRIGTLEDLRRLLGGLSMPQIDFGRVIAIPAGDAPPHPGTTLSAEGPSGPRYAGSVTELVAFDDTYIEIASGRDQTVRRLGARFPTAEANRSTS